MYESPVKQILGEMQVTYENECLKAIQSYGFDVNKEELVKALEYDRDQYGKGYKDGYVEAINEFAKRLRPILNTHHDRIRLDEIAEEMRGAG